MQQLGDATSQGVVYDQIILDLLVDRNRKMATVARQGIEELHRFGEVGVREGWRAQWYEFYKQVRGRHAQPSVWGNTISRAACSSGCAS